MRLLSCQAAIEQALDLERTRIARELHDTLAQCFIAIALQVEVVQRAFDTQEPVQTTLNTIGRLARQGTALTRNAVSELRQSHSTDGDLATCLARLVDDIGLGSSFSVQFCIDGTPRTLDADTEQHFLRMGQEALNNAIRHANPRHIDLELRYTAAQVSLEVRDDGQGFDIDTVQAGYGLQGMHERAEQISGRLHITSRPGQGTEVKLTAG